MPERPKLSELPAGSIKISTQLRLVRVDDAAEETPQQYLTVEGSATGFRWLAEHLVGMAEAAEHGSNSSNILATRDFKNEPVDLEKWDSIEFHCRGRQEPR